MIALPIIGIVCCLAYVVFVVFKFGVPTSISETYYLLDDKWDWLFSAWCVLTAGPFGFYWFTVSPKNLAWIPIVVCISLLMIGVSCRYKSGPKSEGGIVRGNQVDSNVYVRGEKTFLEFLKEIFEKFKPSEFLKYGWARPIHYVSSLIAIILSTVYICIVNPLAIPSVVLSYVMFIIIGLNVDGTYNKDYSVDVDNKAWIFFMEVVCFIQLFVFIWTKF